MAINYSLMVRCEQPGDPKSGNKTYPVAQYVQNLDLDKIAEHMTSHDSKYNKGDIMAVATQLTNCIREQILLGNRITLGDLGTFYVSLVSDAADNAESFHAGMIKKVKVRWAPSVKFQDLRNMATFQFVGTRESQIAARKAERERLNALATVKPEDSNGGDDNNGNEGGLGD